MVNLGFDLLFSGNNVKLMLGTIVYGFGYISDGLIIIDVEYFRSNNNVVSFIISSRDYKNDVMKWYARLNHIGQDRMSR